VRELEKVRSCACQANYRLVWATKYCRKVFLGSVKVRLVEVFGDDIAFVCFCSTWHYVFLR